MKIISLQSLSKTSYDDMKFNNQNENLNNLIKKHSNLPELFKICFSSIVPAN